MPPTPPSGARGWVVFGAGGHARSVIDVIERRGDHVLAVVGAELPVPGAPWPLWESDTDAVEQVLRERLAVVVGVGAAGPRLRILQSLAVRGWDGPALVAASATVSGRSRLGAGTAVLEHAHVGPVSTLGAGVVVNTAAVVEHDCTVGAGTHVAPGAVLLGGVTVGRECLVGSGARVLPGVRVGEHVTIGAGAVVIRDVPDHATVTGVPARPVEADSTDRPAGSGSTDRPAGSGSTDRPNQTGDPSRPLSPHEESPCSP